MLRLLVFRKNGQIGWELERSLCVLGQVTALDRRDVDLLQGDLIEECIKRSRSDVIINAAAYTNVDEAESNESLAFAVNAAAPRSMARGASRKSVRCSFTTPLTTCSMVPSRGLGPNMTIRRL